MRINEAEKIHEEIMTENFLKLMRKSSHRFRKHYKPQAGDKHTTFKRVLIRLIADFSTETMNSKRK